MKIGDEDIMQIQVNEWLLQCHPDLPSFHFANERKCSPLEGRLLKRKGVRKGVLDWFFPRSNNTFKDMWIEQKTKTGKITKEQAEFARERIKEGSCVHISYSAEETILMIKAFYSIE